MLRTYLEDKIHNSWVNPGDFKDETEFLHAYRNAWGLAKAASEILEWVDSSIDQAAALEKKEKDEIANLRGVT